MWQMMLEGWKRRDGAKSRGHMNCFEVRVTWEVSSE